MARNPNAEQLLAIEHMGGVLLRAGAGSGKTFVLVEHIIYLTRRWMDDFKATVSVSAEEYLREKFSEVVMMTFTKKAAGEMSVRLTERFAQMSQEAQSDQEWWVLANDCLPLLTVTTIDGFCRKLITQGYFPHLSTEAKVIFTAERTDQIRILIEEWFEQHADNIPSDVLDVFIREKKALLAAFTNIFSDPGLRLSWRKFSPENAHPSKLSALIKSSFELNDLQSALGAILALDLPGEKDRSAFEKLVGEFQATGLPIVDDVEKLTFYKDLFAPIKVLRGESGKKKTPAHEAAKDGLADLRKWVNIWWEVVDSYCQHFESKIAPWISLCQQIFLWVEARLDPNQGVTFGDIEYLVSLGLENPSDRERIQKAYRYFIVDEFQDTSALQFKIIQDLIGSDFSKLFCVGDAKQAIYGFRGGELSVFQDCSELVPQVRSLANNYRSSAEIIHFNNSLFKTILPLGQEFTGADPFTVQPEDQKVPGELPPPDEPGSIEILSAILERDLEAEGKFTNENINRLEAQIIADAIFDDRQKNPHEVVTILYSKLKPSGELIRALMERKIGFTAQFKIDLLDDPIVGMFLCLLRRRYDTNPDTKDRYPLFLLRSYLQVLGIEREVSKESLDEFDLNVSYWGLLEAFRKFIHSLNITNENSDINFQTVETISELFHQDPEDILVQLANGDNQRISMDLRSGEDAHMVQIMTAHASKGLEFDTVYLAGVYTNGRENSDGSLFGDLPGSFVWYLDLGQRIKQKSPFYLYESELSKYKNFSESKRLFYVACTRAKKKLSWVDLQIPEKTFSIPKNSWIDGLHVWQERGFPPECAKSVHVKKIESIDFKELLGSKTVPQLPLFFHDSVGIISKGEDSSELMIAAELSVTRLNSLLDCPRKFYLENVLKLVPPSRPDFKSYEDENEDEIRIVSSAERGTLIHSLIAKGVERNFIVPREAHNGPHHAPIEWALNELKGHKENFDYVSEKALKFKFFNYMISGIPDLLLIPKNGDVSAQVWDFKTGRINQESLRHYWIQLKVYAYALYVLNYVELTRSIDLRLCYVDQQQFLDEQVTWASLQDELFELWRSQNRP